MRVRIKRHVWGHILYPYISMTLYVFTQTALQIAACPAKKIVIVRFLVICSLRVIDAGQTLLKKNRNTCTTKQRYILLTNVLFSFDNPVIGPAI